MVELESIDDLIKKFNEIHNITGHKIGLLLLGDPRQSGATLRMKVFYRDIFESKKSTSYSLHGFLLDQETAFGRQSLQ
jgi:hypothetical protein